METKIKTIGLLILLSFSLSLSLNAGTLRQMSSNQSLSEEPGSPFEELLALFDTYTERISSVEDEDAYNAVKKEFNEKLSELDSEYPGFEPSESEMRIIEERFAKYEEERSSTCERLEIEDYGEYGGGDDEVKLYDEEVVDSIVDSFSGIIDPIEKVNAVFESYIEQYDKIDNFIDIMVTASTMEAVFNKMADDFDNPALEKAIEDENSELYKTYVRFQESIQNAVNRVTGGEGDEEEEAEDE